MENEITAHKAGTIVELPIAEGAPISAGAPIATIVSDGAAGDASRLGDAEQFRGLAQVVDLGGRLSWEESSVSLLRLTQITGTRCLTHGTTSW